jgi:thiol-disulfide isomerase/thioredoxin
LLTPNPRDESPAIEPDAGKRVLRRMLRLSIIALSLMVALSALTIAIAANRTDQNPGPGVALPPFTQTSPEAWINSAPLTTTELRGNVVLIDFWAFECWNCYRSFPWLNSLQEKFSSAAFAIVGIHAPEFEREKDLAMVKTKALEFELAHPIMLDNDFAFWRALGNRYWPAFYLVDKRGLVRSVFVGETHAGDSQARAIEAAITDLLSE